MIRSLAICLCLTCSAVAGTWQIKLAERLPIGDVEKPPVRIVETVRQKVRIDGKVTTRIIKRYRDTGEQLRPKKTAVALKKKWKPELRPQRNLDWQIIQPACET